MDNDFNKVRPSHKRVQISRDPFDLKSPTRATVRPAERPAQRPAENPVSRPAVKSQPVPERPVEKTSEKLANPQAKNSRTARSKITGKKVYIAIILLPIVAVLVATAILIFAGRSNEDAKKEPEQKETQVVVEKTYPKETATAIDIAIAETEIQITERGHYRLSGETTYPIIVNAPGEVVIYLNGISVAPTGATALANLSEYPLTLILEDNTTTNLQTNSPDANALYSAGDLIIKGGGTLNATGIDVKEGREYKKEANINNLKVSK